MKIAIQANPSRGKEILSLLENLGGINAARLNGSSKDSFYYINDGGDNIIHCWIPPSDYRKFTLEEFEKEFPFKIGDRVISITTNFIGIITELKEGGWYYVKHNSGSLVCVFRQHLKLYKKMKEERNITLTLDKAKEWYNKGGELKEIALQAFSEKELNPLPRSWEEFCKNNPIQDHEAFINYANGYITMCKECAGSGLGIWTRKPEKDRCKCVSKKSAEAHLAMIQLEQLRNCWWNGWEPEWSNSEKFIIKWDEYNLTVLTARCIHAFLVFPTIEMAEEFLKCFKNLIEKAGDLI